MQGISRLSLLVILLYASQSFGQTATGAGGPVPSAGSSGVVTFPAVLAGAPGSTIPGGAVPDINVPAILGYNTEITNITLTDVQHTFAADLDLRLISPGGITYTFNTDNGGSTGLDIASDMVFDVASADCADNWTSSGSAAQPENGLLFETAENVCGPIVATFDYVCAVNAGEIVGDEVNGTWSLEVTDDAGGDVGSFTDFSITFASIAPPAVDSNAVAIDPLACQAAAPAAVPAMGPLALLALAASVGLAGAFAASRRRRRKS